MKIPKIEYEIYYPFNNSKFTKLNLEICKNMKIDIIIQVKIDDDINKHNPNSDYYNNICSKATSKNGADITLSDRKQEFIDNNMTLCEENCNLVDYNYITKKAKCSCDIKFGILLIDEIKSNKDLIFKKFIDVKNIVNLGVLKCFKHVFNSSIIYNYGFFIMTFIMLLFFICLFVFLRISYKKLLEDIKMIIFALNNINNGNEGYNKKIVIK
jgi:hypothetical protein